MNNTESKLEREVRLHLKAIVRGKVGFDVGSWHLQRAINLGLKPGDIVTVNGEKFQLVDNMKPLEEKGVVYRPARFPRFELKEYKEPKVAKAKALIGSCNCLTKTPEVKFHSETCGYRLASEAQS